jgi:glycosyltransferase involved in cell wall biosynthesis
VTGLLTPYGDSDALAAAIRRLYHNPELRVRCATAARTRANSFTIPRMIEGVAAVLDRQKS